jgi:hypothetical protein
VIARVERRLVVKLESLKPFRRQGKDPAISADCARDKESGKQLLVTPSNILGNWFIRDVLLAP